MKVLIIGYGKTGKSLKKYFDKYQNEVFIYDKNVINEKNYCSYNYLKDKLPLFDLGIKSPGISGIDEEYMLIKSLCKEIYSDLDYAFMKLNKCHVIGITGSNGKTSFATYLYHFLSMKYRTFLAGNIGKPLIDYVDEIIDNDYVILELSSFQIRDSKLIKLDTLFYTSLSPNHLNVYIDVNHYYADKKRALFFIKNNEIYFINNLDNIIGIKDNQFEIKIDFIKEIKKYLQGEFSCKYANIAMNYCLNKGFSKEELLNRLITLKPVKYRLNKVFENKQFIFINDSKSTTSNSSKYCFETFPDRPRILILGGKHKSNKFNIKINNNDLVLIYGIDKNIINKEINGLLFNNLEEIMKYIKTLKNKYYVLFSPGCDSHDQYKSFIDRGNHFNELINIYFKYE